MPGKINFKVQWEIYDLVIKTLAHPNLIDLHHDLIEQTITKKQCQVLAFFTYAKAVGTQAISLKKENSQH